MKLDNEQIKTLADAIANSNAHRFAFIAAIRDADGVRLGYIHFLGGISKSHRNAVSLVSDFPSGVDLEGHFLNILGCALPHGGKIEIIKRRKKLSK